MQNPSICDCVIRYVKVKNIQILKIFQAKKCLIGKLVLACEDKILNTTEIPIEDKRNVSKKSYAGKYYLSFLLVITTIMQDIG